MRYQLHGGRSFACIPYDMISQACGEGLGGDKGTDQSLSKYHEHIIGGIDGKFLDAIKSGDSKIYRGSLSPNQFLFVPPGYFFMEKVSNAGLCVGF